MMKINIRLAVVIAAAAALLVSGCSYDFDWSGLGDGFDDGPYPSPPPVSPGTLLISVDPGEREFDTVRCVVIQYMAGAIHNEIVSQDSGYYSVSYELEPGYYFVFAEGVQEDGRAFAGVEEVSVYGGDSVTIDIAISFNSYAVVGSLNSSVPAMDIALSGDDAYMRVTNSFNAYEIETSLYQISISDPSNPNVTGSLALPNVTGCFSLDFLGMTISGDHAYLTDPDLRIIDISNPVAPDEEGFLEGVEGFVAVDGDFAYVSKYVLGWPITRVYLKVIDVSTPSNPIQVGYYDTTGTVTAIAVSNHHVYLACGSYGLRILNVSDPANPHEVGRYVTYGMTQYQITVSGGILYIAKNGEALSILSLSNPASPVEIGHCDDIIGYARDIAVSGDYLYVISDFFLKEVLVSDPSNPVLTGLCLLPVYGGNTTSNARNIAVSNDYAYVVCGNDGLQVVHVGDR